MNINFKTIFSMTILLSFSITAHTGDLTTKQKNFIINSMNDACVKTAPNYSASVKNFCSCYSNELADIMTQEQFNAMMVDPKTGKSTPPPNYRETVSQARSACNGEL